MLGTVTFERCILVTLADWEVTNPARQVRSIPVFHAMALQSLHAVRSKRQQATSKVALQHEVIAREFEQCRRDLDEHGAASICAKHATADMQRRAALLLQLHGEATAGVAARRHKLQVRVHVL